MASIDLFCTVGKKMEEYVSFLKQTCDLLASKKHDIHYYCIGMDGCDEAPTGFNYIRSMRKDCHHDSLTHTTCMHETFDKIQSEYVIFVDVDIAILCKNWDDKIIQLLDRGYACTGFQYRHHFFPGIIMFACKRHLVEDGLVDFRPKINKKHERIRYKIKSKKEADLFGKKVGGTVICDSSWKLPLLIKPKGYKAKTMGLIYGDSENSQLPFNSEIEKSVCLKAKNVRRMSEFHLNNEIFGTHLKGARITSFDDELCLIWRARIAKLFLEKYNIKI